MVKVQAELLAIELRDLAAEIAARRSPDELAASLAAGCWIYGAGAYGRLVHHLLRTRDLPCHGFIDRKAEDPAFRAELPAPVVHPDIVDAPASSALVIALHNFIADQAPVVEWARAHRFTEILLPAELPDVLGPEAGSYWLTGRRHTADHLEQVSALATLLADQRSVDTLASIARFRISADVSLHPPSNLSDQYFPRDLPLPPEPVSLIDGGAYIGDTYDAAVRNGVTLAEWYAFEPDPENFTGLVRTAARADVERIALFPCGLGHTSAQVSFSAGETSGSHAVADGPATTTVHIVALDEVLRGASPTFVKLDIEGFEREALAGMRETLRGSRPRLAMSVYHKPDDLWALPFKVHEMFPEAKLYLRQHGFNGFDTVLYAVP